MKNVLSLASLYTKLNAQQSDMTGFFLNIFCHKQSILQQRYWRKIYYVWHSNMLNNHNRYKNHIKKEISISFLIFI